VIGDYVLLIAPQPPRGVAKLRRLVWMRFRCRLRVVTRVRTSRGLICYSLPSVLGYNAMWPQLETEHGSRLRGILLDSIPPIARKRNPPTPDSEFRESETLAAFLGWIAAHQGPCLNPAPADVLDLRFFTRAGQLPLRLSPSGTSHLAIQDSSVQRVPTKQALQLTWPFVVVENRCVSLRSDVPKGLARTARLVVRSRPWKILVPGRFVVIWLSEQWRSSALLVDVNFGFALPTLTDDERAVAWSVALDHLLGERA